MSRFPRMLMFVVASIVCAAVASAQTAPVGGAAPPTQGRGGQPPVQIGPPAPVPPEVEIARPTPAELEQVNAAVKKFIDADRSATQALLKKFESQLLLQPPRMNVAATFTQTVQRRGPRHEGFVERAKQGNIDLLLHGDSITDWWVQNDEQKAVFDKYFSAYKTANFAISGDTTQGVLWGLRNGEGPRNCSGDM